jgi:hypothetical protein
VVVRNLGKLLACEECAQKMLTQGACDIIEVEIGSRRLRLCTRHFAEMLVLGRSSLPRDRRPALVS